MKKSISKKLLSLFLAVMLLATSIPFAAVNASAAPQPAKTGEKYKYVFAYFTGISDSSATDGNGQKVNLAVSDDGLNFSKLTTFNGNGATGVMKQAKGTTSARDPYLFDGGDGYYYIIATDANCANNNWADSRTMVLWRSKDLLNWGEESLINVQSILGVDNVQRCWAPQVYVCDADEMAANGGYKYMVYFGLATWGGSGATNFTDNRTDMYYCLTNNLLRQETWTQPQLLYRPCDDVEPGAIDGDIVKIGDEYIMYVKDEDIANNKTGTSKTYWVSASAPWGPYENQRFSDNRALASFTFEGGNAYYIGDELYMLADSNASVDASTNNMKLLKATDSTGKNFEDVTSTTNIPSLTPKHGSVLAIPVTDSSVLVDTANEYEVTGNVVIDNPVVYTHGKYAGISHHPYAHMNYGGYISDGSFEGEYAAPTYTLKAGAQITAVYAEETNAIIGYEGGKLTGYLGDDFTSNTVTFVFKFANGTYEKHILAVKTNPVAQHAVACSMTYQDYTYKATSNFEVVALGSVGDTSSEKAGASVTHSVEQNKYRINGYNNYPGMYAPGDPIYGVDTYATTSTYGLNLTGLTSGVINSDKTVGSLTTGYNGGATVFANAPHTVTLTSPKATYYLDLSSSNNNGIAYSTDDSSKSYSFELLVGNVYYATNKGELGNQDIARSVAQFESNPNNLTAVNNSPEKWRFQNQNISGKVTINGTNPTPNTTVSGSYKLSYLAQNGKFNSTSTILMPFNIIVSDKSSLRSVYNQYRSEYKIEKCYTTDSWNAYVTALRAAEDYLGNPENTNVTEMERDLNSLKLAYNALTPVDDISAHQAPATTDKLITDMSDVYEGLEATCGSTGHMNQKCNLCGKDFEVEEIPVQPHTYKYVTDTFDKATFSCEWIDINKCNNSFNNDVDFQVYSALDMVYNTIDHSKYTAAGDEALVAAYEKFVALKDAEFVGEAAQIRADITAAIDAAQRDLLNAINTVNGEDTVNGFNVTFKVVVDGTETYSTIIPGKYGDIVSLDASAYTNGLTCTTWKVSVDKSEYANGYEKNISNASNAYDVLVQSDTTVIAYASAQDVAAGIPVTINDQYGNALYSLVAPADTAVTFESVNKIIIGEMAYEVPNMPFYKITGWQSNSYVNGSNVVATDAVTTVGAIVGAKDSLVITPIYAKPEGLYTITLDGEEIANLEYDKSCTVRIGAGTTNYGIAIRNADNTYSIVSYSNNYTFYANRDMDFFAVTKVTAGNQTIYAIGDKVINSNTTDKEEKLMIHNLDNKLPFVYSAPAETETGKFTTFSAFSKNAGNSNELKIVEVGTLYTKADVDENSFVIGASGVYTAVSKNQIEFSNQYSLSLKNSVGMGVKTRAYVKYSYVYGGETIEAIAYGNICTL